jgi:hypothetical protein
LQDRKTIASSSQAASYQASALTNDSAIIYQQQQQRSLPSQTPPTITSISCEDIQRSLEQLSSQSSAMNNAFFSSPGSNTVTNNDILSRLTQARQMHDKQQHHPHHHSDKIDERHRREQQQSIMEARLMLQLEQEHLKRQTQEQMHVRQRLSEQYPNAMDYKKAGTTDRESILSFQQSMQLKKEQQAQIEAQKFAFSRIVSSPSLFFSFRNIRAENVRRYQQHYRDLAQQPSLFRTSDVPHWTQQTSFATDQLRSTHYRDMPTNEPEQDRRFAMPQQQVRERIRVSIAAVEMIRSNNERDTLL